jgi:hypothetical protein
VKNLGLLVAGSCFLVPVAGAYIPPLGPVAQKIFVERKLPATTEIVVRHRIDGDRNPTEIEERIFLVAGRPRFVFRVGGRSFAANRDSNGYRFPSDVIESRSGLFLKALFSRRGDEFLERAVAEQFVRREQLSQFKSNYDPSGDPKTWKTTSSYLRHADIELSRLPQGVAILVTNGGEPRNPARSLYFDRELRGIARFEWRDSEGRHQWDFPAFTTYKREGTFPTRWVYRLNGRERVRSEVLALRAVSERQVTEALRTAETPSGDQREALAILLGSR